MSDSSLSKFGAEVFLRLGDGPGKEDVLEQRRMFLSAAEHRKPAYRHWGLIAVGAVVTVGLALGIFGLFQLKALSFWIGLDQTPGMEGEWVEASGAKPFLIRFEGGSEFALEKGSAARVVKATKEEVLFDLSKGHVKCQVQGNGKTRWVVRAGTYRIWVVGTGFSVDWDPTETKLDVTVNHGSVLVSGAALSEHGVQLSAGDHLSVTRDRATIAQDKMAKQESEQEMGLNVDDSQEVVRAPALNNGQKASNITRRRNQSTRPKSGKPDWKELYSRKEYERVVDLVTDQGLDHFIQTAGAEELWKVGKAARHAKRGDAAYRVLEGLIQRFPNSRQALNGTFLLGRVAIELNGNPRAAQKWFERYLSVDPNGALAEGSLGRLIDVCGLSNNDAAARKYARKYLSRYPGGPFAKMAQSVLESK